VCTCVFLLVCVCTCVFFLHQEPILSGGGVTRPTSYNPITTDVYRLVATTFFFKIPLHLASLQTTGKLLISVDQNKFRRLSINPAIKCYLSSAWYNRRKLYRSYHSFCRSVIEPTEVMVTFDGRWRADGSYGRYLISIGGRQKIAIFHLLTSPDGR
jgi:hypothetical protein